MRVLYILALFALLTIRVTAQGSRDLKWTMISSEKKDFVIAVPADFLVYADGKETSGYCGNDEVSVGVHFRSTSNAKKELKQRQYDWTDQPEQTRFVKADFTGIMYTFERGVTLDLASSNGSYSVVLDGKNVDDPTLRTIVDSIKVDDEPLIKRTENPLPSGLDSVGIKSLKTSPEIREALGRKQRGKVEIVYDEPVVVSSRKQGSTPLYSNPLIILKKTPGRFSDEARRAGVNGNIVLRVLFKGDGDIGKITVVTSPTKALSECAVAAAKEIKFFPARVAGQPADVSKLITYTFVIY